MVANTAKLQLLTVMRAIAQLKSRLQRTNPLEAPRSYNQMFSELVAFEARAQGTAHPQHRSRRLGFGRWPKFCCSTMPKG